MFIRNIILTLAALFFAEYSLANEATLQSLPLDLSPKALYDHAHPVVKGVILILIFCSILTWTVFLFKSGQLYKLFSNVKRDNAELQKSSYFKDVETLTLTVAQPLVSEIQKELAQSNSSLDPDLKSRIEDRILSQISHQIKTVRSGIGILATIGSVTPFIGLFGTVWGIMNSFIGIAQTRSTDLFAVAPGIAEALFATALGLVAAIPAVIIYNALVRQSQHYAEQLQEVGRSLLLTVRRDISQTARVA